MPLLASAMLRTMARARKAGKAQKQRDPDRDHAPAPPRRRASIRPSRAENTVEFTPETNPETSAETLAILNLPTARDHDPALESISSRRSVSRKGWAFIRHMAESNCLDPLESARIAGLKDHFRGNILASKYKELIEREQVRLRVGRQMELDEALKLLAILARPGSDADAKTQHAALRTILEVHGALSRSAPTGDRSQVVRSIEEIVSEIKGANTNKITNVNVNVGVKIADRSRDRSPGISDSDPTVIDLSVRDRDHNPN